MTRWGILSAVRTAGIRRQATWHRENTLEDSQYMNTAWVSGEKMLRASCEPSQLVQRPEAGGLGGSHKAITYRGEVDGHW